MDTNQPRHEDSGLRSPFPARLRQSLQGGMGLEHPLASSAQGLEHVEFATAIRGYDKDEVNTFLKELATEHNRMMAELVAAQKSAENVYLEMGEEIGDILQHAKDVADQMIKRAEEEAAVITEQARRAAAKTATAAARRADQLKEADQEIRARISLMAETIQSLSLQIADMDSASETEAAANDEASEIAALTKEVTTSPTPSPA
jgi:DivIVA domain-containing protein